MTQKLERGQRRLLQTEPVQRADWLPRLERGQQLNWRRECLQRHDFQRYYIQTPQWVERIQDFDPFSARYARDNAPANPVQQMQTTPE